MNNELYHHGILGQKWGVRRFQNKDGTLTSAGRRRYDGAPKTDRPKMDEKTRRTIGTTLVVGGTIAAASGIIAASALISDIKVNKEADRAIQKAQGFVAEMLIDKNPDVRESAKKGLAYMRNFLARG